MIKPNNNPIETTIHILDKRANGRNRYLISIDDKINLFELSFFNGTSKQAHERAVFLLKNCIKKYCKITDEEVNNYFLKGGLSN